MAVGNVGETLAPYIDSDTFLSRDGGFTWEEVHKDAHLWEFGDSGSIILLVNDEEPTDHVLFTTDEGITWREYQFSQEKLRIKTIVTVPEDTSRKFMLLGIKPQTRTTSIVHIDFTSLTHKKCELAGVAFGVGANAIHLQVYWMWRIRVTTILSCGARARRGRKCAYSVAR